MTPTPAWCEADSDDSDRNATDDNTASTPDAARGANLPAPDAPGGYADADVLKGRIAALEGVSAENERLRAIVRDVEALADKWERRYNEAVDAKAQGRERVIAAAGAAFAYELRRAVLARSQAPQAPAEQEGQMVPDWSPTILVLRQLATTLGETPREHLPKGAVVDTLNQVADRLLAGGPAPSVRPATADDEGVR